MFLVLSYIFQKSTNIFFYFSTKTYVIVWFVTALLMSSHNISWWNKYIATLQQPALDTNKTGYFREVVAVGKRLDM